MKASQKLLFLSLWRVTPVSCFVVNPSVYKTQSGVSKLDRRRSFLQVLSTPEAPAVLPVEEGEALDRNHEHNAPFIDTFRRLDMEQLTNYISLFGLAVAVGGIVFRIDASIPHPGISSLQDTISRIPMEVFNSYETLICNSPLVTNAATSATVYTIGDVISQRTEGVAIGRVDKIRTLRSLLAGLIGHGPLSHYWYQFSEGLFNNVLHLTEWWSFVPKVMLDQTTWGPIWNNSYILLLGLMKIESLENIWSDMKRSTVPLIVNGLKLWVPVHCVTYGLIPVENRLLWVDMVEIIWVTILASQAAAAVSQRDEEKADIIPRL